MPKKTPDDRMRQRGVDPHTLKKMLNNPNTKTAGKDAQNRDILVTHTEPSKKNTKKRDETPLRPIVTTNTQTSLSTRTTSDNLKGVLKKNEVDNNISILEKISSTLSQYIPGAKNNPTERKLTQEEKITAQKARIKAIIDAQNKVNAQNKTSHLR